MNARAERWRSAALEGAELGLFMISACLFGALLEFPGSPLHRALPDANLRRVLMGFAMGVTAVALIYSPWGRRSGAHMNPATTLTFWRLGRVSTPDAAAYVIGQFAGGAAGALLAASIARPWVSHPAVHYVVTKPGMAGVLAAFWAEAAIAFVLLSFVLRVSASRFERFTGVAAGLLIWLYIAIEAPVSGMSMNPARTLASTLASGDATALWLYFVAPPLGMLAAAQAFLFERGGAGRSQGCAKFRHDPRLTCRFCGRPAIASGVREPSAPTPH
jgi:aquaporin Z